jgi:hypothetical protein
MDFCSAPKFGAASAENHGRAAEIFELGALNFKEVFESRLSRG